MDIIDTLSKLSVSRRRSLRDDDFFIDRLHHRYTVAMLVLFCAVVTTNQYAGEPINCWVPAQFTGSFEAYTNRLCWLQNTYYVEENHDIPDDITERNRAMLKYYQWVHLIILLQSVLFIIPRIIWRSLNDKCGIEIVNFVDAAIKFETVEKYAEREKLMEFLSGHVQAFIRAKDAYKTYRGGFEYRAKKLFSYMLFWTGKRFGNYLVILYTFVKLLYLINVVGQLFLMTRLLGISNYYLLGFEILHRMALGLDMIKNHYFPKVTHCDFKIRELGNDHQYTVQCVLSINIFTEKIYVILWFWFVILSLLTFFDLLLFLFKNCLPSQRYFYVKKHVVVFSSLHSPRSLNSKKESMSSSAQTSAKSNQLRFLNEFSNKFLKPDIVLVLKIIASNVNGLVVSELVKYLWETFLRSKSLSEHDIQEFDYEEADDDNDQEDGEKAAAFPLNRQPAEEKTANDNSGPKSVLRRLSVFKPGQKTDDRDENENAKTIKTGEKQSSSTPIAIV